MKKSDFGTMLDEVHMKLKAMTRTKGEEYTGSNSDDQLANFHRDAALLGVEPEVVIMIFLNKHWNSVSEYVRNKQNKTPRELSEPIIGRVDDAILYLILLRAMIMDNEHSQVAPGGAIKYIDPYS